MCVFDYACADACIFSDFLRAREKYDWPARLYEPRPLPGIECSLFISRVHDRQHVPLDHGRSSDRRHRSGVSLRVVAGDSAQSAARAPATAPRAKRLFTMAWLRLAVRERASFFHREDEKRGTHLRKERGNGERRKEKMGRV